MDGDQLWEIIEGMKANNLLEYSHLLTGACSHGPLYISCPRSEGLSPGDDFVQPTMPCKQTLRAEQMNGSTMRFGE